MAAFASLSTLRPVAMPDAPAVRSFRFIYSADLPDLFCVAWGARHRRLRAES